MAISTAYRQWILFALIISSTPQNGNSKQGISYDWKVALLKCHQPQVKNRSFMSKSVHDHHTKILPWFGFLLLKKQPMYQVNFKLSCIVFRALHNLALLHLSITLLLSGFHEKEEFTWALQCNSPSNESWQSSISAKISVTVSDHYLQCEDNNKWLSGFPSHVT